MGFQYLTKTQGRNFFSDTTQKIKVYKAEIGFEPMGFVMNDSI